MEIRIDAKAKTIALDQHGIARAVGIRISEVHDRIDLSEIGSLIGEDEHITVADGRGYDDVSPDSGVLSGGSDLVLTTGLDVLEAT